MRQIVKFFWIMGLSLLAMPIHAAPAKIEGLSFQPGGGVVFELNAVPRYRYFTLKNPSRLVVDFENTAASQSMPQPPAEHPLVVGVRSAIRNKSDLRVVMELSADAAAVAVSKGQSVQLQFDVSARTAPAERLAAPAAVVAKKQKTADAASPALAKPIKAKGRDIVIAIDAGHGGKDVGAQGGHGTQEKDVVLAIAKRLESAVNRQPGMKAVMIRNGDYFVKLRERVRIAQAAKADLFISIHADAFDDPSAHGASVYTLANKGASSQIAQYLANSENASDGAAGIDEHDDILSSVLMDLSNKAAKEASQHVGNKVLRSVKTTGHLHRANVQKAGFVVLKSPIPSILVETAFISNPEEERRLNTRAYQDKMASAVFNGIMAHFKQYAPANTLFAQLQKSGKSSLRLAAVETDAKPVAGKTAVSAKVSDSVVTAGASATRHVIGRGDTLSGIARQYGVSMRELRHANGMEDGQVKVGQVLQIPRSS